MIKVTLYIVSILFFLGLKGQEHNANLKFYSADIGFGFFLNNSFGGMSVHSSIALKSKKNLFAITAIAGGEINILGGTTASFEEYNLMYGRELKLAKWMSFEGFAGVGYYNQNSCKNAIKDDSSVSLPLKVNTKFYFNKHFGMGIMNCYTVSDLNNNFTTNLLFHYRFN